MNTTLELTHVTHTKTQNKTTRSKDTEQQAWFFFNLNHNEANNKSIPKSNNRPHGMIGYVWSELSLFAEKIDTFCNRNRIAIGTLGGLIFGAISAFYWCFAAHHSELLNTNFIGLPMMFTIMAVICFSSVFIKAMTSNPSIETEGFEEKSQKSLTS